MKSSIFALLLLCSIGLVSIVHATRNEFSSRIPTMHVGTQTIRLLIAKTPQEISQGLSGHEKLPKDMGMLFYFDTPAIYPFWMPNMKFPLDIIWIKENTVQEVVQLGIPAPGQPIPLYTPSSTADRVLEVEAGLARQYGLVPGAQVVLPQ